jgi:hypothetical protein
MQIIGPEPTPVSDDAVHTIDVWYSESHRHWTVQRLNAHGAGIGPSHRCRSRAEATACVADWMRRHPETHLITPYPRRVGGRRGQIAAAPCR